MRVDAEVRGARLRYAGALEMKLKLPLYLRCLGLLLFGACAAAAVHAEPAPRLAPGIESLPADARVVIEPIDLELYTLSAGGQREPRADWTDAARRHVASALREWAAATHLATVEMDEKTAETHAELLQLQDTLVDALVVHHNGAVRLPAKRGQLDWSFGSAMQPLQQATGARYALYTYVRDSYASSERKVVIGAVAVVAAALSGGSLALLGGGEQAAYAMLVDLQTGQVLWFNELVRLHGDLREAAAAADSVKALLTEFPPVR
jgi:hypothetical protein